MQTEAPSAHKVRTACDICHKAKMKCSRGNPCMACARSGNQCRYSISNRLGRPPKGTAKNASTNTRGKERESHHQSAATAAQLLLANDHTQPEDLPTLDDMFMDGFSDSSYALSSPETLNNQGYHNVEDTNNMVRNLSPAKDDHQPWTPGLEQFHQSPAVAVGADPFNTPQSSPRPVYNTAVLLHNNNHGYTHRGEPPRCHCLQQHFQFMCQLNDMDRIHHSRSIAVSLDAAKQSLRLWQAHLSCRSCCLEEDNDALLLLLMCIGTVVKRLWGFLAHHQQQRSALEGGSAPGFGGERAVAGVAKTATSPTGSNFGEQGQRNEPGPPSVPPPMKINVGEFQVPEEEQIGASGSAGPDWPRDTKRQ
ncbi:hypothetical protein F4677DRAFT_450755 [Hypoxylon crocopeplum]|nr:hypothetical protein F4677DRAFT_450755 [Hypoxylon crocopeplum]